MRTMSSSTIGTLTDGDVAASVGSLAPCIQAGPLVASDADALSVEMGSISNWDAVLGNGPKTGAWFASN